MTATVETPRPEMPGRFSTVAAQLVAAVVVIDLALIGFGLSSAPSRRMVIVIATVLTPAVATAAAALAAWDSSGRRSRAWWLLAGSAGAWTAGQVPLAIDRVVHGQAARFPSPADAGHLVAVVLLLAGLWGFLDQPEGGLARVRMAVEALMVALSLLLVSWAWVLETAVTNPAAGWAARAVALATPLGGVLVVTLVVMVAAHARRGTRHALTWLAIAAVVGVAADTLVIVARGRGDYASGSLLDLVWVFGFLCFAFGALETRPFSVPRLLADGQLTRAREFGPFVVLPLSSVVVLFHLHRVPGDGFSWWGLTCLM
ncbi:MAG TPA: hypothetical protein VGM93_00390, partial [Acidimicrobiales bacterium]